MEYEPVRGFNHGQAACLSNLELGETGITERGRLLAEIEFLTSHAAGPCVCVVTHARSSLSKVAELFRYVHFYAYNVEEAEYDPDAPSVAPFTGFENVTAETGELDKATMGRWGARDHEQTPLLLITGEESTDRLLAIHTQLKPNHALIKLTTLPPDFLSGRMLYPIHAGACARLCFLDAPRHAHARLCYPDVWAEELAYFHAILRGPGAYDNQAETWVLQTYARTVLAANPQNAWIPAEKIREALPAV